MPRATKPGFSCECLEPRKFCAAAFPTPVEQYELELINRARANPSAEAARFSIDLNEGLPAGTISSAPKQPLAINPFLTDAAREHSQWMIDQDVFSHTGAGNSSPHARMSSAGYSFVIPFTSGENIGYRGTTPSVPNPTTTAAKIHEDLFVDAGIDGRGHRKNILNNGFREIGVGIVSGKFNQFNSVMVTTDFAASASTVFLTGVAYNDTTTTDNFYTPGEGLGGVTITATRIGDGAVFTTTTWSSGGYSLALNAGKYVVIASGSGFSSPLRSADVVIGSENVKRDFRPADAGTVRGSVFRDDNANGVRDDGEPPIAGVLLYLDTHRDGKRNKAELYARTNADGAYAFRNLAPGSYRVRQTLPAGHRLVAPTSGYHSVTLGPGKTLGGRNFADELL
jgi:uncharacterized protein YkwD